MKKIMFKDKYGLTKAVLEGRKTMTRRIAFSKEINKPNHGFLTEGADAGKLALCDRGLIVAKSTYKVGEVVAVAQCYKDIRDIIGDIQDGKSIKSMAGWNNKMFVSADLMPHQIRITHVKVERLQDISDKDCLREGIYVSETEPFVPNGYSPHCANDPKEPKEWFHTPREAFASLIDKVSGKGTFESNPWVFVYEFELVK